MIGSGLERQKNGRFLLSGEITLVIVTQGITMKG
jgi:hypothetical protein